MADGKLFRTPLTQGPQSGSLFRTPLKKKFEPVSAGSFNQFATPITSMAQPWIRQQLRFPTKEEQKKQEEEKLKEIDRKSREPRTSQLTGPTEISAGKPRMLPRLFSEPLFGTGIEGKGLVGKAKELGIVGSARRLLGFKTPTQAITDRANKLIEQGIAPDRAWTIAQEDVPVKGSLPLAQVKPTKTVALTAEEEKVLKGVRRWEMFDTVMNAIDVASFGRTKIAREGIEQLIKNFAKTSDTKLIGRELVGMRIPVEDAIRLAERITPVKTEDEVIEILNDYARTVDEAAKAPTPRGVDTPPVTPKSPVVNAEELILEEARKYRTADEFVKAQGTPVYHGTRAEFDTFKQPNYPKEMRGGVGKSNAIFFAPTKKGTEYYSGKDGRVIEAFISNDAKIFDYSTPEGKKLIDEYLEKSGELKAFREDILNDATKLEQAVKNRKGVWYEGGWEKMEEYKFQQFLKEKGFDGFRVKDYGGGDAVGINNLDIVKTKPELTDIWKKANP